MGRAKKTKEEFICEFLEYAETGGDLRSSNIKGSWRTHIRRHFGDYETLLKELGFDFEKIHGTKRWDKEKVIASLQERVREGKSINPSEIKKDDTSLRGACELYFGNVSTALEAAGFHADDFNLLTYWDKESIKSVFTNYIAKNPDACISSLSRDYKALDHAIRKHYGTYEAICEDLGIDVSVIKRQEREWNGEALLHVLKDLRAQGQSLNIANVLLYFPSAYQVAKRSYGSYENALKEIGEEYEKYVDALKYDAYIGKTFEKLLAEMFIELGRNYSYQKRRENGTIMPDFVDEKTNEFIDAKLSSWTLFHSDTADKYLPVCDKLTIVYLRGKDIPHELPRTELRHVSYYYDELLTRGLKRYIDKFTELQRKLDETERAKREAS